MNVLNIPNKIFEVVSGSHAYGLNTPESDVDTRGLFIKPLKESLSLFMQESQISDITQDSQFYDIRKYLVLLEKQNPSILELLWIPERHILYKHPVMDILISKRADLISSKVKFTYAGYAIAQIKRLRGHQKWITNPQSETPPALWDYVRFIPKNGIEPANDVVGQQILKNAITSYTATKVNEHTYKLWHDEQKRYPIGFLTKADQTNPSYVDVALQKIEENSLVYVGTLVINLEAYQEKMRKWAQYWEWKNNRNVKRAVLEEKVGYDVKHASHTIRLLYAVKTILTQGIVPVQLPDKERETVLDIKLGKWAYEDVMKLSEEMEKDLEALYQNTMLPKTLDKDLFDKLYLKILEAYYDIKFPV